MDSRFLHGLGIKHRTDKASHVYHDMSYLDIYDRHFASIRHDVRCLIEIGVLNGSSLRMWREYFPNATIVGVDINPDVIQYHSERIDIVIGDQNDEHFLNDLCSKYNNPDIVIDDGSHITSHQIKTFNHIHPIMAKIGFYVIEDLRNSYEEIANHHDLRKIWPGMAYNRESDALKNYREDLDNWIKQKVKDLDFHNDNKIFGIYHYPMILMIENR